MVANKRSEEQSWEEAGYSNNFVFRLTMDDEPLCKELLERLLEIKIDKIEIRQQEKDVETGKTVHGVRLDIYIKDSNGNIYDVEMQSGEYSSEYFAKRTRYYQSMLDQELLKKNISYRKLKRTVIIFICTFDPLGYNLSKYTLKTSCAELPAVPFKDGSTKIFFNAVGNGIGLTKKQKIFLDYVANGIVKDDFTNRLKERIDFVKQDEEKKVEYMTWQQEQIEQQEIGKEIGKIESIRKLLKAGIVDLLTLKNSGLYTPEELKAIAAT